MIEISLSRLKEIQIEILSEIDIFCKENEIRYSLCGGSLLGAVRHKGYIPWDDDIDVMMPREDYDRFVGTYRSDANYLFDFSKSAAFRETFIKVCRRGTVMVDNLLGRGAFGVNVDVFPIDGVPEENSTKYVLDIINRKENIAKYCAYYKQMNKNRIMWFFKFVLKRVISLQFSSVVRMKEKLNRHLRSTSFCSSKYAGVITGSYGVREVVDRSVFDCCVDMEFEQRKVSCIIGYDTYLTSIYGDYMQLPPEEKRVTHHNYKVYSE